jgi:hypothetical protein
MSYYCISNFEHTTYVRFQSRPPHYQRNPRYPIAPRSPPQNIYFSGSLHDSNSIIKLHRILIPIIWNSRPSNRAHLSGHSGDQTMAIEHISSPLDDKCLHHEKSFEVLESEGLSRATSSLSSHADNHSALQHTAFLSCLLLASESKNP